MKSDKVVTKTGYQADALDMRGGAKYVTVAQRSQEAHHAFGFEPGYTMISSKPMMIGDGHYWQVVIKVNGRRFIGTASINFGGRGADQTNPVENAETSALGRALGFAGFGSIDSIASAEEIAEAKRRQASGYQSKPPAEPADQFQLEAIQRLAGQANLVGAGFAAWLREHHNTSWSRLTAETANKVIVGLQELVNGAAA